MRRTVTVYPRVERVVARKPDGSRWEHRFTKRAAILGNRDGSLTIRADDPKHRLHKLFNYEGKREPFLINPPGRAQRNDWPENREVRMGRWVAPRHAVAALKGWKYRYAEHEYNERHRVRPKLRRGRQPVALAHYAAEQAHRRAMSSLRGENPVKKNPLQIINSPRGTSMSRKRRMPPGLARYWAKHRRARRKTRRNAWKGGSVRHSRARRCGLAGPTYHKNKENPMARRRRRRHAAKNYGHRRRHTRRARHNPPLYRGGPEFVQVAKDGAAVAGGILLPQLALRMPQLAKFADTPMKRAVAKAAIGFGLAFLSRRFVGKRVSNMLLVGTGANILLADVLPKAAPQLGLGMSDAYDPEQFPTFGELTIPQLEGLPGAYGREAADLAEMATY